MLQRLGATWPVRPLLLCAGAANTYISSSWTHPCFFLLCAGAVNTQLVLDYVTTHDNDITRRLSFLVRRRSEYAHFVFLGFCGHPWLLQSCPHGPYWGPLGVLTASLDDPSRSSGAFPVPPGALCDHTGCSHCFPWRPESLIWLLPGPPGALSGHSEATLLPNWCPMASPTCPSEVT